jgi:hypothetical protein
MTCRSRTIDHHQRQSERVIRRLRCVCWGGDSRLACCLDRQGGRAKDLQGWAGLYLSLSSLHEYCNRGGWGWWWAGLAWPGLLLPTAVILCTVAVCMYCIYMLPKRQIQPSGAEYVCLSVSLPKRFEPNCRCHTRRTKQSFC